MLPFINLTEICKCLSKDTKGFKGLLLINFMNGKTRMDNNIVSQLCVFL